MDAYEKIVNREIGARIKKIRKENGLSQKNVATFLGISYQHFQKYESGKSCIYAARLKLLAILFKVEVSYFYI